MTSDAATIAPTAPGAPGTQAYGPGDTGRTSAWRAALRWELALVVLLVVVLAAGRQHSARFLDSSNLFYIGVNQGEVALMALPLLLIVMIGEIDLSVASMLGLSGTVMGYLFADGWPLPLAIAVALAVGALGGALNGLLVARLGLPSIAVTIGTLTLFRGIAEIVLAPRIVTGFPASLSGIGVKPVAGSAVSWSALIFLVLAVVCGVVLHATPLGRSLFAMGLQPEAARFAGIRVQRITFGLYVLSGVMCAFAGILFSLKNASVSYDAGTGLELDVVAVVLFGGVSIFGGRGTVLGVVLSVAVFGTLLQVLTQMGVQAEVQKIVTGGLLLLSVIVPNLPAAASRFRRRARQHT